MNKPVTPFYKMAMMTNVIGKLIFSNKENYQNILIVGNSMFFEKIKKALELLKDRSRDAYKIVSQSISMIIETKDDYLSVGKSGASLLLTGSDVRKTSDIWLAGIIAFYGFRAKLYNDAKQSMGINYKIPNEIYSGKNAWDFQYNVLNQIGSSYDEMNHLVEFLKSK